TSTASWFAGCGTQERVTDPAGRSGVTDIDGFCRPRGRQTFFGATPIGPKETTLYSEWIDELESGHPDVEVKVTSTLEGGATTVVAGDRLGRAYYRRVPSFGFEVESWTEYDRLGRAYRNSLPAKVGDAPTGWTTSSFDAANRPVEVTRPDGTTVETAYDRFAVVVTDPNGHITTSLSNAAGQIVRVSPPVDPDQPQHDVCYQYGGFGALVWAGPCVPTPSRTPTTIEYDDYGRQLRIADGQHGVRTARYDSYGRLFESIDGEEQVTRYRYDALDRVAQRIEGPGTDDEQTAEWHFDAPVPGAPSWSLNAEGTVRVTALYDEYARPRGSETTIYGRTYVDGVTYDERGRVATKSYPSPIAGEAVMIVNTYNGLDQLVAISRPGDDQPLWQPLAVDALGHTTLQEYGNGVEAQMSFHPVTGTIQSSKIVGPDDGVLQHLSYAWHQDGRLAGRTRHAIGQGAVQQSESFSYNPRGELAGWTTTVGGNVAVRDMDYDGLGNIVEGPAGVYQYAGERLGAIVGQPANVAYDGYDGNGSLTSRSNDGAVTEVGYDRLGRVAQMDSAQEQLKFTYDADGRKVHVIDRISGRESYYLGSYQEEHGVGEQGEVVARHALAGVAQLVRIWSNLDDNPSFADLPLTYVQPGDHLGSTSLVTDELGAVEEERSYDPWGAPRDPGNWMMPVTEPLAPEQLNAGFGGTEGRRYGDGELVHMGARVYDQRAGRFIQADTLVPSIYEPRDWNRYAFVRNAPTVYVDPSGHAPTCPGNSAMMGCWDGTQETMPWSLRTVAYEDVFMRAYGYSTLEARSGLAETTMIMLPDGWKYERGQLYHYTTVSVTDNSGSGYSSTWWAPVAPEMMNSAVAYLSWFAQTVT
ncbi:MAG: hypothetical protein H0V89_10875, partial [Deltaproteobacteria bacterium]|nr:hypothetical protein [Deltaproteobacteria bacterium]